jgi:molybdopterin-guanine dinucleotide biosynthesis protein A
MGADKALVQLNGQPLVSHALGILREAGLPASIAGARSQLSPFAPVVPDIQPGLGPLGGICAALAIQEAQKAVFLSVDQPLLPASLLTWLLHHATITGAPITLAAVNGFAQTFPVVIDRAALTALSTEFKASHLGCFSAFQAAAAALNYPISILPAEILALTGHVSHPSGLPASRWFLNANTPADLRRIRSFLSPAIA